MTRWVDHTERLTRSIIVVNLSFVAMTLWLLRMASSATSSLCLTLGCLVIAVAHTKPVRQNPAILHVLIPLGLCLYLVTTFGFGIDISGTVAEAVGRDPTLTDRTLIWKTVLSIDTNPLVGVGYESFWLGSRLERVWASGFGTINEAHNGYIQVYLNLGIIGLTLLLSFLITAYRTICTNFQSLSGLAPLSIAVWAILLFYNISEAAFLGGLLWLYLLPAVLVGPGHRTVNPARKGSH